MHILHMVTRLLRAGSEENTIATCRWQAAAGHRVTLVHGAEADPHWRKTGIPGVRLICVPDLVHPISPVEDARALAALRKLYRKERPDVIHTHQSKAGILGRLAADAAPGATVVHGIHIVPFDQTGPARKAVYLAAERLAARRTDLFIGVSDAVCRTYVDAGIARPDQVHCVRSGMDLDRFRGAPLPEDWRDLLCVPRGTRRPPVLLMLAAFEPRKRHVPFLRAFAPLARRVPDLRLLLAGTGPEEPRVRAEAQALGLMDRVVFCGHRPDPERLLALADLSVLASEREGLPRVVVQSLAAGCPVALSALTGIDEIVRNGVNGLVTPAGDCAALVTGIGGVLGDAHRLARLRDGARQTDVGAWSLDTLGATTTALYTSAEEPVVEPVAA